MIIALPPSSRSRLAALCLAWAAWAAGCGPGVGGTGTGETSGALALFGATAAAVCTSELAPALACPSAGTAAAGSAIVFFADAVADRRVLVRFEGNEIEFSDACARFGFRGVWGAVAGQPGRFYGYGDPDGDRVPATLEIVIDDAGLKLTVRDLAGTVLRGPLVIGATGSDQAPSCDG